MLPVHMFRFLPVSTALEPPRLDNLIGSEQGFFKFAWNSVLDVVFRTICLSSKLILADRPTHGEKGEGTFPMSLFVAEKSWFSCLICSAILASVTRFCTDEFPTTWKTVGIIILVFWSGTARALSGALWNLKSFAWIEAVPHLLILTPQIRVVVAPSRWEICTTCR